MSDPYRRKTTFYRNISGNGVVATGDSATKHLVPASTLETLFIQKIHVEIITGSAKTWTFQDTANTPVVIAIVDTTSAPSDTKVGHWDKDFGPEGYPLTEAKGLDMAISGAGAAGNITWEGYAKRTVISNS
jgi:hypothetical protein